MPTDDGLALGREVARMLKTGLFIAAALVVPLVTGSWLLGGLLFAVGMAMWPRS
jgi:hypothetical protein